MVLRRWQQYTAYFVAILVLLAIVYYIEAPKVERFSQVSFPTPAEMAKVVDASPYFHSLTPLDLYARGRAPSREAYKQRYLSSLVEFTSHEKAELSALVEAIEDLYPTKRLSKLPWRFAKVSLEIEHGWPHTLEDVIILPEDYLQNPKEKVMLTLVHEKVHVFQRAFPKETAALVTALGYTEVSFPNDIRGIARSNPDISGLYQKQNMAPVQVYNSSKPSSIADSTTKYLRTTDNTLGGTANTALPPYVTQAEHPFEMMAVTIPLVVFKNTYNDPFFNTVKAWCKEHL